MKVCWINAYTEAHRTEESKGALFGAMSDLLGEEITTYPTPDCEFIICGSVYTAGAARAIKAKFPSIPIIHYSWDIYPFQVNGPDAEMWAAYLGDLRRCH